MTRVVSTALFATLLAAATNVALAGPQSDTFQHERFWVDSHEPADTASSQQAKKPDAKTHRGDQAQAPKTTSQGEPHGTPPHDPAE